MLNELKIWFLKKVFEYREVGLKLVDEEFKDGTMIIVEKEGIPIISIGGYPYGSTKEFGFKEHTQIREVREGITYSRLKELSILTTEALRTRIIINEEVAGEWSDLLEGSRHKKDDSSLLLLKILLLKLRKMKGGNENEA